VQTHTRSATTNTSHINTSLSISRTQSRILDEKATPLKQIISSFFKKKKKEKKRNNFTTLLPQIDSG
jgi:hypothetical protein